MGYRWRAIPESTWAGFSLAAAGLAGAICVTLGAPEQLSVAITAFVGAAFRLVVALIGALLPGDGTVETS